MSAGALVVSILIGVPALVFALWPLLRGDARGRTFLPIPADRRQQLAEDKRRALAALRELEFEHTAGHVSDADFADLRARYESEAAAVLTEIDRLGPAEPAAPGEPPRPVRGSPWRHPLALGTAALLLVAFGIIVGAGIVRYTEPDPMAGQPPTGSRPLAALPSDAPPGARPSDAPPGARPSDAPPGARPSDAPPGPRSAEAPPGAPSSAPEGGTGRVVPPEVLNGMLQAARGSLAQGRYGEAIAAYQAVLKRDPKNVDAMTHLALIVAIGGGPEHVDRALETFDRALAIDPNYPPALLYRGQVLYEMKQDVPGAIRSWEKFVAVTPPGEERARVAKMLEEARAKR